MFLLEGTVFQSLFKILAEIQYISPLNIFRLCTLHLKAYVILMSLLLVFVSRMDIFTVFPPALHNLMCFYFSSYNVGFMYGNSH